MLVNPRNYPEWQSGNADVQRSYEALRNAASQDVDSIAGQAATQALISTRPVLLGNATPSMAGVIQESAYYVPYGSGGVVKNFQLTGILWCVNVVGTGTPSLKLEKFTFNSAKTVRTETVSWHTAITLGASLFQLISTPAPLPTCQSGDMIRLNVTSLPASSPSGWFVRIGIKEVAP